MVVAASSAAIGGARASGCTSGVATGGGAGADGGDSDFGGCSEAMETEVQVSEWGGGATSFGSSLG